MSNPFSFYFLIFSESALLVMPTAQNTIIHRHKGTRRAYNNKTKFDPNKYIDEKDKLHPSMVASAPSMCCRRCALQIKWKIDYGKYVPLEKPKKCNACSKLNVALTFHKVCQECCRQLIICAKCQLSPAESARRAMENHVIKNPDAASSEEDEDGEEEETKNANNRKGLLMQPDWGMPHESDDEELRSLAGLDVSRLRGMKKRHAAEEERKRLALMKERVRRAEFRKRDKHDEHSDVSDDSDMVLSD